MRHSPSGMARPASLQHRMAERELIAVYEAYKARIGATDVAKAKGVHQDADESAKESNTTVRDRRTVD